MSKHSLTELKPLNRQSRQGLPEWIYDALIDLLLDERLEPGEPLRIDAVAAQLGVSATPVREALVRLQATGLLIRETHKGFRVAPRPSVDELVHLLEARLALEPVACRFACERAAAKVTPRLAAALAGQRATGIDLEYNDFRDFLRYDQEFHRAILDGTGNHFLLMATEAIGGHVQRYRAFQGRIVTDRVETLNEHQAIVDAFEKAHAEAAAAAMTAHLTNLQMRLREQTHN